MSRFLLAVAGALLAVPAHAGAFGPGGNSGALARSFALPMLGDTAVLAPGRSETGLLFDVTNEYLREGFCADECLVLDGETSRLRLLHRWGLRGGWDLRVEIPLLDEGGGFLDGWIQDWHRWFGLPNGGREQVADDQYLYRYQRTALTEFERTAPGSGLGDVTVGFGRALGRDSALRGAVKLPTSDESLVGGHNTGGALWLDLALPLPAGWDGYVAGGASLNERGDLLPRQQNEKVFFGGLGLLMPFTARSRLHVQVQGHTRLYEGSTLSGLARPGAPLTLGLQFRPQPAGATLELGFLEDLSVGGSPDFAAYVAISSGGR